MILHLMWRITPSLSITSIAAAEKHSRSRNEFAKLSFYDLCSNYKMDLRKSGSYLSSFKSVLVGDARNIYDGIVKVETSGLRMADRRTAIELLAIRERLQQACVELRWIESDCDMADGLTKPWKHEPLSRALKRREICIVYDPQFQSSRKKKALRRFNDDPILYARLSSVYEMAVWANKILGMCESETHCSQPFIFAAARCLVWHKPPFLCGINPASAPWKIALALGAVWLLYPCGYQLHLHLGSIAPRCACGRSLSCRHVAWKRARAKSSCKARQTPITKVLPKFFHAQTQS